MTTLNLTSGLQDVAPALAAIPAGRWIMCSRHEAKLGGVVVKSVFVAADVPPLIGVTAWKGHGIEPIVRDSRAFSVNLVEQEDRTLLKKFAGHLSDHADQFDATPHDRLVSTAPALKKARLSIDCEVVRHFDIEADHELYIGLVLAARLDGVVAVRPRDLKK